MRSKQIYEIINEQMQTFQKEIKNKIPPIAFSSSCDPTTCLVLVTVVF